MSYHWVEVWKDVWNIARWILPPLLFFVSGAMASEDGDWAPFFLTLIGIVFFGLAMQGEWI